MTLVNLVLLVGLCLAVVLFVLGRSLFNTDGGSVTTQDFPGLVSALEATGKDGAFWVVLIPGTATQDDTDLANLQYSIEDNIVGMDWVLLAKRNIEDRERFRTVVRSGGAETEEKVMNDVRYLRATGARDLPALGVEVLRQLYDVKPDTKLELIISGFRWK